MAIWSQPERQSLPSVGLTAGRVRACLTAWRAVGAPHKLLKMIGEGVRLPWLKGRRPNHLLGQRLDRQRHRMDPDALAAMNSHVDTQLSHGHMVRVSKEEAEAGLILPSFMIPKTTPGSWRFITDGRPINEYLIPLSTQYDDHRAVARTLQHFYATGEVSRELLRGNASARPPESPRSRGSGEGLVAFSFDIQDAFYTMETHPDDCCFLYHFIPGEEGREGRYVQMRAMPFGLSSSPHFFEMLMVVLQTYMRDRGVRLSMYCDDGIVICRTVSEAFSQRRTLSVVLSILGLSRHPDKGSWMPTQRLIHLGLGLDLRARSYYIPRVKERALKAMAKRFLHSSFRQRELASMLGKAEAVRLACPILGTMITPLYRLLRGKNWDRVITFIPRSARTALRQVVEMRSGWGLRYIPEVLPGQSGPCLATDASKTGWGCVHRVQVPEGFDNSRTLVASGFWVSRLRSAPIHLLEARALHLGLQQFLQEYEGKDLVIQCDNSGVVAAMIKGRARDPHLHTIISRVWRLLSDRVRSWVTVWVASQDMVADGLSRLSPPDPPLELLPQWMEEAARRYGRPTVDRTVGMGEGGAADPLHHDWRGQHSFCCPPHSRLDDAVFLVEQQGVEVTLVTPRWSRLDWFRRCLRLAHSHFDVPAEAPTYRGDEGGGSPPRRWSTRIWHFRSRSTKASR